MIQINLQWFAYPCWIFAFMAVCHAVYSIATTLGKPDILPMLGISTFIIDTIITIIALGLGSLIWLAFRR